MQATAGPVTVATGAGYTLTGSEGETVPEPQTLVPKTETGPETAVGEKLTVIELVPLPEVMVAPAGRFQVYPDTLGMAATE